MSFNRGDMSGRFYRKSNLLLFVYQMHQQDHSENQISWKLR